MNFMIRELFFAPPGVSAIKAGIYGIIVWYLGAECCQVEPCLLDGQVISVSGF
jgi:hypothetical protein